MFGIIDVGGGTRGVYSSGIYDAFIDRRFKADYCIGVSAGAANLITYVAGQRGRTYRFYRNYFTRKECVGAGLFLKNGIFLSLDYLYDTLSREDGEDPLDYRAFAASDMIYRAVATKASDGTPHYFTEKDFSLNDYAPLKASCCLPIVCKGVVIGDEKYYDGGMSDPVPFKKAFEEGCDKVLVVLTKPREDYYVPLRYVPILKTLYPKEELVHLAETLHERYRTAIEELEELEKQGKAFILEPKDRFGMKTLTKDSKVIDKMYDEGYEDGLRFLDKLKETEKEKAK